MPDEFTAGDSVASDSDARVQHFVDLAEGAPGLVDALHSGSIDALVDFLELAPGAHIKSVTVEEVPGRELVS